MAGCWISWTAGMLVALNINWACVYDNELHATRYGGASPAEALPAGVGG